MSLGYPPLRPQPDASQRVAEREETYGVPDQMTHGFSTSKKSMHPSHELEFSEQHWEQHQDKMNYAMLRNLQGVAAPLKLHMERSSALKVQRLPGLKSSNLMLDTLSGKLDTIDFDDVLGNPIDAPAEMVGLPHAVMEKRLGLM